jgi:hypothetical protein
MRPRARFRLARPASPRSRPLCTADSLTSVLHILTAHFNTPVWLQIQTKYLREHITVPYTTWASLEKIDSSYGSHFDHVVEQVGRHSDKLNHLAIEALHRANDDDLLMFLDGDAIPITDPMPLISASLAHAPLLAVRRLENAGDPQPHPCFCVTTAKLWRELGGDWSKGYVWRNEFGHRVSDVGANLLRKLELTETPWVPVLRSNRTNLDPVLFGIYGDTIYHHGAGFRGLRHLTRRHLATGLAERAGSRVPLVGRALRRRDWQRLQSFKSESKEHLAEVSLDLIAKIERGDSEWLRELI